MKLSFSEQAWRDYLEWQRTDKKMLKKINDLIEDIVRNGNMGMGRPEALKYELSGMWSRRINLEHRLIYKLDGDSLTIMMCKGHH